MRPAPLAGVRVLDLTRLLAGPFCTMLLGDYGADVVKVEPRGNREFRAPGATQDSYFFLSNNRSKRSLTLDLKSEAGRALFLRILPRFDVVVENYRPGVMEAFGLGAESLRARHPRLVYCAISGFMSVTGTADQGPTRAGIAIGDLLARIANRDVDHWVGVINEAGVPAGPVLDLAQVFSDPQVLARGMRVALAHPEVGTFETTGLPVKLESSPGAIERRPPLLGEHTDEVLRECGLDDEEIAALRAAAAI